jgi:hypothetical protein
MLLFVGFLLSAFSVTGLTVIEGNHKDYAGENLQFYTYADPVSLQRIPLFSIDPAADGSFYSEIAVDQPVFAYCDFGIYRGMIIIEPQKSIRLKLPPKREKSFADQKNPYFKPVEFWFATESGNHTTDQIQKFDMALNRLTDQYFNQLYFNRSSGAMDSVLRALKMPSANEGTERLRMHRELKIKALEADALRLSTRQIAASLQKIPLKYSTFPAFIELFEKAFTNQLSYDAKMEHGATIRKAVALCDMAFFATYLNSTYGLKEPLAALALLKMAHDGFYSGDFQQEHMLKMIASPYFSKHSDPLIRSVSNQVKSKLEFLRKDSPAPVIILKNTNGHPYDSASPTAETSRKYMYLVFADTEMVVCQEHLKYLTSIQEKFSNDLEIIVILRKTELIPMKMFLDKEKVPGVHLIDEKSRLIEAYQVKSFPACFLLTPDHRVAFTDVKAPLDGFELQLASFLKQQQMEKLRNQGR